MGDYLLFVISGGRGSIDLLYDLYQYVCLGTLYLDLYPTLTTFMGASSCVTA